MPGRVATLFSATHEGSLPLSPGRAWQRRSQDCRQSPRCGPTTVDRRDNVRTYARWSEEPLTVYRPETRSHASPMGKAFKRIDNGGADSLEYFYQVFTSDDPGR